MPRITEQHSISMQTRAIDWWQYMDGQEWVFTEGEDYDPGTAQSLQASAHNWCSRNNNAVRLALAADPRPRTAETRAEHQWAVTKVRTKVTDQGKALHIRAYFPYRPADQQTEPR